jgi:transcriptional regulator with XRE-family HTH domain
MLSYEMICAEKAKRLREYRESLRLNQTEFAAMYHSSQKSISRYETGAGEITAELEFYLAKDGLNLNWLVTGEGGMKAAPVISPGFDVPLLSATEALYFNPEEEIPNPKSYSGEYPKSAKASVPMRILSYSTDLRAIEVFDSRMAPLFHAGDIAILEALGWNGDGIYLYRMGGKLCISRAAEKDNSIALAVAHNNESIPYDPSTFQPIGRIVAVVKDLAWEYMK